MLRDKRRHIVQERQFEQPTAQRIPNRLIEDADIEAKGVERKMAQHGKRAEDARLTCAEQQHETIRCARRKRNLPRLNELANLRKSNIHCHGGAKRKDECQQEFDEYLRYHQQQTLHPFDCAQG